MAAPTPNRVTHPVLRAVTERVTRTHCPYCAFQCGMTVKTTSGATASDGAETNARPEVRPDAEFPVNRGQMCIKGFTSAELLEHPGRLLAPMIRGRSGRLVPASWEAALDFVAEGVLRLRAKY